MILSWRMDFLASRPCAEIVRSSHHVAIPSLVRPFVPQVCASLHVGAAFDWSYEPKRASSVTLISRTCDRSLLLGQWTISTQTLCANSLHQNIQLFQLIARLISYLILCDFLEPLTPYGKLFSANRLYLCVGRRKRRVHNARLSKDRCTRGWYVRSWRRTKRSNIGTRGSDTESTAAEWNGTLEASFAWKFSHLRSRWVSGLHGLFMDMYDLKCITLGAPLATDRSSSEHHSSRSCVYHPSVL
ncbi:uncharacterized protein CC84DRAFT_762245 [Paraphaeosphaeria sporulosa]|uniref:Uncharacterized protein n=1 Tax=Paraphaeosphaeria sporulosa TaxID=1460663 RepID=A0A177CHT9_9PLEO|nr:uncharacterized protein CC84DRAFT_762245 [Paraphaeosphaeria sporulosa]OAG06370.1 hypothetical protein CC84DRAFT_762245 [Paraphaeosphaeria sporulosa]